MNKPVPKRSQTDTLRVDLYEVKHNWKPSRFHLNSLEIRMWLATLKQQFKACKAATQTDLSPTLHLNALEAPKQKYATNWLTDWFDSKRSNADIIYIGDTWCISSRRE